MPDNLNKLNKEKEIPENPVTQMDTYMENGYLVFTKAYHLRRGYCCGNGCRHCPFKTEEKPANYSNE